MQANASASNITSRGSMSEPPAHLEHAMWLVWVEGGESVVGPVSARQIARGIRSGRVPADASVQREGEVFWSGVLDEPAVIAALKTL